MKYEKIGVTGVLWVKLHDKNVNTENDLYRNDKEDKRRQGTLCVKNILYK